MTNITMTRKEFKEAFSQFKEGIALEFVNALIDRCPVDNGFLKASIDYRLKGKHIEIFMLKYGRFVEFGTPPHIIRPKNKKALRFEKGRKARLGAGRKLTDNDIIFAKEVRHPGTRPNPFIRTALRIDLPRIIKQNCQRCFT